MILLLIYKHFVILTHIIIVYKKDLKDVLRSLWTMYNLRENFSYYSIHNFMCRVIKAIEN